MTGPGHSQCFAVCFGAYGAVFSGTAVSPYAPDQAAAVCLAGSYQFFGSDRQLAYRIGCPAWTAGTIHPGPLFVFPFATAAVYLGWMFVIFSRNSNPGRRMESWATVAVALVMIGASGIEVILHLRGVLWSTATICLILLFFALTVTKVLYDPLTGTYSRLAYQKRLECIRWKGCQSLLPMVFGRAGAQKWKSCWEKWIARCM